MQLDLTDKVIQVAAASQGLGYAIAEQAAAEGARLCICSRDPDAIDAAAQRIRDRGAEVMATALDVRDGAAVAAWTEACIERFGRLDGLVVNAGGPPAGGFDEFEDADWQAAFELNLLSAVRLIRAARPALARSQGAVLTITSSAAREPIDALLLSNVMRSGVVALVKSLSRTLGSEGIRVNNLIPGTIETDRLRALHGQMAQAMGTSVEAVQERVCAQIPLGRLGQADEFARAAVFLLSPIAGYISGANLQIDGGALRGLW